SGLSDLKIDEGAIRLHEPLPHKPERTLLLGWNERAPDIITQLDTYVAPGSGLTAVADRSGVEGDPDAPWRQLALKNQTISFQAGDTTDRAELDRLNLQDYQHVVVLPYSDTLSVQKADARTLITLLHLRDISHHTVRPFAIVSEMLDVRNRAL